MSIFGTNKQANKQTNKPEPTSLEVIEMTRGMGKDSGKFEVYYFRQMHPRRYAYTRL